jgi:hypothetical protein
LDDLQTWLRPAHVSVSIGTLWKTLRDLQLTLKKNRSEPPSKHARMSGSDVSSGGAYSPS